MDALKFVPQLFFDLIGRIVPGGVVLVLYTYFYDSSYERWKAVVGGMGGAFGEQALGSGLVFIALTYFCYVIGHLLSPLTKLIQHYNEQFPSASAKADSYKYDWLRLHESEAGGHCAKLRAEFTMYNSLSGVFLVFSIAVLSNGDRRLGTPAVLLLIASLLMAYRGREGSGTFAGCVERFYKAAHDPAPKKPPMRLRPKGNRRTLLDREA
jgi:hypothetical protein